MTHEPPTQPPDFTEEQFQALETAFQRGLAVLEQPVADRVALLEPAAQDWLANFALLGWNLDLGGFWRLAEISQLHPPTATDFDWLVQCLELGLVSKVAGIEQAIAYWVCPEAVFQYFLRISSVETLKRYHTNADAFMLDRLAALALDLGIDLPEGPARRQFLLRPYGFLDQVAHLPQHQELHNGLLSFASTWFYHLFWLEEYVEAAQILNQICFAMARRGQRKMAQNMLAMVASKTSGLTHLVAKINLATLLREEQKLSAAFWMYLGTLPGLLWNRAYTQLAQVLTEIAAVSRQGGNLIGSVILLEISVLLNGWLKNRKSQAIASSQLASSYRHLRMFSIALHRSNRAVDYFRSVQDLLNLGRSLLTKGNIHYSQTQNDQALACFEEARKIGRQIGDPQSATGALSGKARVFLNLKRLDEAQSMLEEAISLRERNNDHNIGIEYSNLAAVFEQKGNLSIALGWYQKALAEFEKYMPVEAPAARQKIALLQKKMGRGRK